MKEEDKVFVPLVGEDGNIFSIMGRASRALKHAGFIDEAAEMIQRVRDSQSYEAALGIVLEYVNESEDDGQKNEGW